MKRLTIMFAICLMTLVLSCALAEPQAEEIRLQGSMGELYGELKLPGADGPVPLVILSHGFGGSHRWNRDYADALTEAGYATFNFDFCGGGPSGQSEGSMLQMSVLTEAEDLNAVIDHFLADGRFDQIILWGESQGGFVSTYVAGTRPQDVAGLIALYPAYVLQDNCRASTPDPENIPDTLELMGMQIGGIYNRDAMSFDIYDVMAQYTGKTLILHGTADSIVPISYSERALEVFPDAELIRLENADHGFYGTDRERAIRESVAFIHELAMSEEDSAMRMWIGDTEVQVKWENNESVDALKQVLPLTVHMSMYGGFEQVGSLGGSLPRNDRQTTTSSGDIVLYSGNQIVVFYGSNSWAYTRLGKITDRSAEEMRELLGRGDVTIRISQGE